MSTSYTPVPDDLFDRLLPDLSEAELKVFLYIIRRTAGFSKEWDTISFSQFQNGIQTRDGRVLDRGCGIKSRSHLSQALSSLQSKMLIEVRKGADAKGSPLANLYKVVVPVGHQGVVPDGHQVVPELPQGVVPIGHLQKTVIQKTEGGGEREKLSVFWQSCLVELAAQMSSTNFNTYLRDSELLALQNNRALIALPTQFQLSWVEGKMQSLIEKAMKQVMGEVIKTQFTLLEKTSDQQTNEAGK